MIYVIHKDLSAARYAMEMIFGEEYYLPKNSWIFLDDLWDLSKTRFEPEIRIGHQILLFDFPREPYYKNNPCDLYYYMNHLAKECLLFYHKLAYCDDFTHARYKI